MSSLRSARALPNDYWTAETVEDYMRCKVQNFSFLYAGDKICVLSLSCIRINWCKICKICTISLKPVCSHPMVAGDQLPDWSSEPDGEKRSFQDLDPFKVRRRKGEL